MGERFPFWITLWQFAKRIIRGLGNRISRVIYYIRKIITKQKRLRPEEKLDLKPGDRVRVKTKKEIESTLDSRRRYQNCLFMDEMGDCCGKTYTVLKVVHHILDEKDLVMRRTKNMVILEGLKCPGTRPFTECDRSCYFFWKTAWLEKIKE
jgi:hypothetical protein